MASIDLSTKLRGSTHRITAVLAHAMLEWILILLLLLNSLLYQSIKRFASFFRLKPTCLWCVAASFDRGSSGNNNNNNLGDVFFCEAHSALISELSYCANHKKLVASRNACVDCVFSGLKSSDEDERPTHCCQYASLCARIMKISEATSTDQEDVFIDDDDRKSSHCCSCCGNNWSGEFCSRGWDFLDQGPDTRKGSIRCEEIIPPQDLELEYKFPDDNQPQFTALPAPDDDAVDSSKNQLCHVNGESLEAMMNWCSTRNLSAPISSKGSDDVDPEADDAKYSRGNNGEMEVKGDEKQAKESKNTLLPVKSHYKQQQLENDAVAVVVVDPYLEIIRLTSDLESERNARKDLALELEAERSASAVAANQTMAMITRLQEEKSAIKTEALQYQRMMEEQTEYDQEALQLLNELVIKREREKRELQEELRMCREKLLNEENEPLVVGKCEYKDESTGEVMCSVDNVLDRVKNWNMLEGSLEDFEEERTSILHQLKELEEKLYTLCEDHEFDEVDHQDQTLEEEHLMGGKCGQGDEKIAPIELCSKDVNLIPPGCIVQSNNSMALAAQKLLPMLEPGTDTQPNTCSGVNLVGCDDDDCGAGKQPRDEMQDKMLAIVKEMDHVYGRLHALEADREFLRHCVCSLSKGDKGVNLLGEILAHLRELRAEDNCGLLICQE